MNNKHLLRRLPTHPSIYPPSSALYSGPSLSTIGYRGPACSRCDFGFYRDTVTETCEECQSGSGALVSTLVATLVILAVAALIAITIRYGGKALPMFSADTANYASTLFVTWQVVVNLSDVHQAAGGSAYPAVFQEIVSNIAMVITLNFFEILHIGELGFTTPPPPITHHPPPPTTTTRHPPLPTTTHPIDCVVDNPDFSYQLYAACLIPVGVAMGTLLFEKIRTSLWGGSVLESAGLKWILVLLYFMLTTISTKICNAFACTAFDDGQELHEFLSADMHIRCDSLKYRNIVAFATVMFVVFPIGVPTLMFVLLWRRRRDIIKEGSDKDPSLDSLAFLFRIYRRESYFVSVVSLSHRIVARRACTPRSRVARSRVARSRVARTCSRV